jgi:hypothetical protein
MIYRYDDSIPENHPAKVRLVHCQPSNDGMTSWERRQLGSASKTKSSY